MDYIKASWKHDLKDQPILFYSELDDNRDEIRKIEIYRDENFELAGLTFEFGGTMLGLAPVPSLDEINSEPQFLAQEISKEEFEAVWTHYVNLSNKNR